MNALEKALHERAVEVAKRIHRDEAELLEVLQRLEEKKVFRTLGYSSLFQYALAELNFSEAAAYQYINVARKAREIPEMKQEIKAGNLTVSKAKRVVGVIQKDNAALWLEKAKTLPKAKLEKEIAKVSPKALTPERSTYVTEKRLNLQVGVDEELYEKLQRVKDLLSQKLKRAASLEDALAAMADLYIEREDPVEKAKRVQEKHAKLGLGPVAESRAIPAASMHAVMLRDNGQCSALLPSGERCSSRRWTEIHHLQHRKNGGGHAPENLQLLCFSHHRQVHAENTA